MTERDFVEGLQGAIKSEFRGAVVFKHAETLTSGIPDLSISALGATSWVEVKYLRKNRNLRDKNFVKTLQVVTCHQLVTVCNGRCWIVVYHEKPKATTIWKPQALGKYLWPSVVAVDIPSHTPGVYEWGEPAHFRDDGMLNLREAINYYGAVTMDGHCHEQVTRLIREATAR